MKTVTIKEHDKLSRGDVVYTLEMMISCLITFWIITYLLQPFVERPDEYLGGMWAVVATVFVFRGTNGGSVSAGLSRMVATCVSFALCQAYLLLLPFHPLGMAGLIGMGTVVMILLGRRDDIVTTGITTVVIMVAAALSPDNAWLQPILRFLDTVVGIVVGVSCTWLGSCLIRSANRVNTATASPDQVK